MEVIPPADPGDSVAGSHGVPPAGGRGGPRTGDHRATRPAGKRLSQCQDT